MLEVNDIKKFESMGSFIENIYSITIFDNFNLTPNMLNVYKQNYDLSDTFKVYYMAFSQRQKDLYLKNKDYFIGKLRYVHVIDLKDLPYHNVIKKGTIVPPDVTVNIIPNYKDNFNFLTAEIIKSMKSNNPYHWAEVSHCPDGVEFKINNIYSKCSECKFVSAKERHNTWTNALLGSNDCDLDYLKYEYFDFGICGNPEFCINAKNMDAKKHYFNIDDTLYHTRTSKFYIHKAAGDFICNALRGGNCNCKGMQSPYFISHVFPGSIAGISGTHTSTQYINYPVSINSESDVAYIATLQDLQEHKLTPSSLIAYVRAQYTGGKIPLYHGT